MKPNQKSTTIRILTKVHKIAKKAAEKDGRYLESFTERALLEAAKKVKTQK